MYYHREDRDELIRYLALTFPRTFFENPRLRIPLKRNIIDDLNKRGVLDPEKVAQAVSWYQSHFSYRHNLVAGTSRVDLEGNSVGTVTPQEHQEARDWITARRRELSEAKAATAPKKPAPTPSAPIVVGTKAMAPTETSVTPTPAPHPDVAELRHMLDSLEAVLVEERFNGLRPVLAAAALGELTRKVDALRSSLTPASSPHAVL
jgi:sRNA-binding protein